MHGDILKKQCTSHHASEADSTHSVRIFYKNFMQHAKIFRNFQA